MHLSTKRLLTAMALVSLLTFGVSSQPAGAAILWNGDFSSGNFSQWPNDNERLDNVGFAFVPPYGAPSQVNLSSGKTYSYRTGTWFDGKLSWNGEAGDGSLISLVQSNGDSRFARGPTRGSSPYAARFVIKSQAGGGLEPRDCDIPTQDCGRRRTQLHAVKSIAQVYSPNVHLKTRWYSVSIFIPPDQPEISGSRWGPSYFGILKVIQRPGSVAGIKRDTVTGGWEISTDHRRDPDILPTDALSAWWETCRYTAQVGATKFPELLDDFPDPDASRRALANLNRGGWTDFVFRVTYDWRVENGTGSLDVWMRAGSAATRDADPKPWTHVIHQKPKMLRRDSQYTLERGIGFNFENGNNGGAPGVYAGIYASKEAVWSKAGNHEVVIANVKVGDDKATFEQMSPDGSSVVDVAPQPPIVINVQ